MDHKLCKNCKGFCCDDIGLFISPHDLQNSYHTWLSRRDGDKSLEIKDVSMSINPKGLTLWRDIYLIYPMLIFSHQDHIHPDGEIKVEDDKVIYHYSCKHHNKKSKDCDIYEERPMLCRTYPDSGFCGYTKITDKRVKEFRPKWFKIGMSYHDWYYEMHPDEKSKEETNESKKSEV